MAAGPWIRTTEELSRFARSLAGCRAVALDSESDGLYHYRDQVCLIQIATDGGEERLLDTLELRDLSPLAPALADPALVKVFHAADYDVTSLKRDFGLTCAGLFDTMIATRFAGAREVGLQATLRNELGIEISKARQTDDWSRRPLSEAQLTYALGDVRHLLTLRERLSARLGQLGRLSWVEEESEAVAALEPPARENPSAAWQRLKGIRALDRRGLAVIRSLHEWREERALAANLPPFKIVGTEAMLALATKRPQTSGELSSVKGLSPRLRGDRSLLRAIADALALPEQGLPTLPRSPRPVIPDGVKRREEALRAWRQQTAAREALDVSVILPQRLIDPLSSSPARSREELLLIPGFRRWRTDTFGEAILDVLRRCEVAA